MKSYLVISVIVTSVLGIPASALAQNLECLINPEATVALSPAVEGVLDKVFVDRGDLVKAGQAVATLESSVERVAVLMAQARAEKQSALKTGVAKVEFGDRRYVRTLDLFKKELVPLKEMDEAETAKVLAEFELLDAQEEYRLAKIELDRARAALNLRTVTSSISGVVVERLLNGGEFTKQAPIVKLAQIDPLRVEVIAPVLLFGRIKVGSQADVAPEEPVGGEWRASVTVVDRVIDAASGTFGVRLALPNPDLRLPAGLKCKVRFNINGVVNGGRQR
jgi:RND family efflux transporter MFP subunit